MIKDSEQAIKEFLRSWQVSSMTLHPEDAETLAKITDDKARQELARVIYRGEAGVYARYGKKEKFKPVE